MSTNWRELCREVISTRGPDYYRTLERARKALADGPAVPEGREPASVTQQSTNMPDWRGLCEELLSALNGWHQAVFETGISWVRPDETYLLDRARAALAQPELEVVGPTDEELDRLEHPHWEETGVEEWGRREAIFNHRSYARAVLARWGHPAPPPAEGEVVPVPTNADQAALMAILGEKWLSAHAPERLRHPAPVPVSERLPEPNTIDSNGGNWWGR